MAKPHLDQGPKIPGIIEDTVDENGIPTIVEFTVNDDGKKVKVCKQYPLLASLVLNWSHKVTHRIKRTLQKQLMNHTVAEWKHWSNLVKKRATSLGPTG